MKQSNDIFSKEALLKLVIHFQQEIKRLNEYELSIPQSNEEIYKQITDELIDYAEYLKMTHRYQNRMNDYLYLQLLKHFIEWKRMVL